MQLTWGTRHGKVFSEFVENLKMNTIRYFVLRNYQGLPDINTSKDVDIIIEPGKLEIAKDLLLLTYKQNEITYYSEAVYGKVHCILGMDTQNVMSIHIDLIEGYQSKGYEIFSFNELYGHTIWHNGFCVMDDLFDAIMLYIYKQFGYKKPKLKQEYKECISETYRKNDKEFKNIISAITDESFGEKVCEAISQDDYKAILSYSSELTKKLRRYAWRKRPIYTSKNVLAFWMQKFERIVWNYMKYAKTFAVMAPDGTGKTTFLDALLDQMYFYYVNIPEDGRFTVYHFRPTILPNLGAVGEKAGVMKQDTNFTDPHRAKPANPLSSLLRIIYYTMDYILGWKKCIRNDVQFDRYSVFDRYSYDFIVDPLRTRLNLPLSVRKFFVSITPQPHIVFVLDAKPEVVYARKQELTLDEIRRQRKDYLQVAKSNKKRFVVIDAEQQPEKMAKEAVEILLDKFAVRL